jgi:hypothetical protein
MRGLFIVRDLVATDPIGLTQSGSVLRRARTNPDAAEVRRAQPLPRDDVEPLRLTRRRPGGS